MTLNIKKFRSHDVFAVRLRAAHVFGVAIFFLGYMLSCGRKTPLVESAGFITIPGAYHSATEQVSYLFFEIHENERILEHAKLQYAIEPLESASDSRETQWKELDLNSGIHLHSLLPCGSNIRCGSFSWASDNTKEIIKLKMLYHPEGSAALTSKAATRPVTEPTAMIFGVFDEQNEHIQIRVEDNFGIPSRVESPKYGMKRRFLIRSPGNSTVTNADMDAVSGQQRHNYLFPATFCNNDLSGAISKDFTGYKSWLPASYIANAGPNGVCFTSDAVDKNGTRLTVSPAFARRNPKFSVGQYKYSNPLTSTIKIPIVIAYCSDAVGAGTARDDVFFRYQRNIIGYGDLTEDLCFTISDADTFRSGYRNLIATKLAAAKSSSTTAEDYIFTIVLHQNLTAEFRAIHQVIAEETNAIILSEESKVSPRLAGAFVYDSRSDYRPTTDQESRLIWCPQTRPVDPSQSPSILDENCITANPVKLNLEFLNFVTSLGPFPPLSDYKDYVTKYGDRGLSKKPELTFASVPQNGNTFRESQTDRVTYFDSERLVVGTSDHVRVCWERDKSYLLGFLRLREDAQAADIPGVSIITAESQWRAGVGNGSYRLGLIWELPFVGKITYKSSIQGTFVSLIPFGRSFNAYQRLGDPRWLLKEIDMGNLLQVCKAFCHHPYFDEHGTYQLPVNFDSGTDFGCVTPRYPVYGEDS